MALVLAKGKANRATELSCLGILAAIAVSSEGSRRGEPSHVRDAFDQKWRLVKTTGLL